MQFVAVSVRQPKAEPTLATVSLDFGDAEQSRYCNSQGVEIVGYDVFDDDRHRPWRSPSECQSTDRAPICSQRNGLAASRLRYAVFEEFFAGDVDRHVEQFLEFQPDARQPRESTTGPLGAEV